LARGRCRLIGACSSLIYRDVEAALEYLQRGVGVEVEEIGERRCGAVRAAGCRQGENPLLLQPDLPEGCVAAMSSRAGATCAADSDGHH
jgi:hypothetical protein